MAHAPHTSVIVTKPTQRNWNSGLCDCCAPPGGCGRCCFASCCVPCAAGDVAAQVGNSYILTCAVPLLATMVTGLPLCILGCIACNDRQELIRRHNLPAEDPCCSCLTLTFCACCAVIQELNELEAYGRAQAALGPKQHVVLVPAGAAVPPPQPQMVMMPAPQPAAPVAAVAPWAPATTATV